MWSLLPSSVIIPIDSLNILSQSICDKPPALVSSIGWPLAAPTAVVFSFRAARVLTLVLCSPSRHHHDSLLVFVPQIVLQPTESGVFVCCWCTKPCHSICGYKFHRYAILILILIPLRYSYININPSPISP
jgi:hypothetical protein